MARENKNLIVALDIGTSKVACLVAELAPDGALQILGMGGHESKGLKKGVVVNIEATVAAIQRALEEAELMADCKIASAFVGIAGSHIRSFNSTGMVAVKDREVSALDVDRAIDTARAVNIPTDQQILHVLRQEFIIDGQEDVREPIGMSGVRLEVKVHIVTGAVSAAQNIVKCVRRCGLEVNDLILQPLASSRAVLSEDEKDLGVCLLDIGGGTTDVAVFFEGSIRHTAIIPFGGSNVTNDIAIGLRTPIDKAEAIKILHGSALASLVPAEQTITVSGVGGRVDREISRRVLASMIEPRMEEIFLLANKEVKKNHFAELLGGGVVLTGGTSLMPGIVELAEQVFEMPVRLGIPQGVTGLSANVADPRFSTGVGLVLHGARPEGREGGMFSGTKDHRTSRKQDIRSWISNLF